MRSRTVRQPREFRDAVGARQSGRHGGVAHRAELRAAGVSRHDVASEVAAGRWTRLGRHTVLIGNGRPGPDALLWRAVWETGAGAVLDGAAALVAGGMVGYRLDHIDVSLPTDNRRHVVAGVRRHRRVAPLQRAGGSLPRVAPAWAAIHAAQWAGSDREAALLLCLPLQQRLVTPRALLEVWSGFSRSPRRPLIAGVVRDVADGAQSLGELDFAALCRRRGLPEPSRQVVRRLASGRIYLDVAWESTGLVVEIDGGHHALALNTVSDALRANEVVLGSERVLRIPVLGLRLDPDAFLSQVARAHRQWGAPEPVRSAPPSSERCRTHVGMRL